MTRKPEKKIVDVRNQQTQYWLDLVFTPEYERKVRFESYRFPTDRHASEALAQSLSWTEIQAKSLLRALLISNGSLGHDSRLIKSYSALSNEKFGQALEGEEFVRRLFSAQGPWEGITWILDLLPARPLLAIQALEAYYAAHVSYLPDGRADGLFDAMSVIRRRYFHAENSRDAISTLTPQEFEFLVAALYKRMGFEVGVTRASKDGGIDVVARDRSNGGQLTVYIQCKHHARNIRVQKLRELAGLVLLHHANKGVLVCSSDFTAATKKEASSFPTVELVGFFQLNQLLNQHLGSNWPTAMSYEIRSIQYEYDAQVKTARAGA